MKILDWDIQRIGLPNIESVKIGLPNIENSRFVLPNITNLRFADSRFGLLNIENSRFVLPNITNLRFTDSRFGLLNIENSRFGYLRSGLSNIKNAYSRCGLSNNENSKLDLRILKVKDLIIQDLTWIKDLPCQILKIQYLENYSRFDQIVIIKISKSKIWFGKY